MQIDPDKARSVSLEPEFERLEDLVRRVSGASERRRPETKALAVSAAVLAATRPQHGQEHDVTVSAFVGDRVILAGIPAPDELAAAESEPRLDLALEQLPRLVEAQEHDPIIGIHGIGTRIGHIDECGIGDLGASL